jgi:hypothetical protein
MKLSADVTLILDCDSSLGPRDIERAICDALPRTEIVSTPEEWVCVESVERATIRTE